MSKRSRIVSFEAAKGLSDRRRSANAATSGSSLADPSIKSDVMYRDSGSFSPVASGKSRNKSRLSAEDTGNLANIFAIDFEGASKRDDVFASDEFDNPNLGITGADIDDLELEYAESVKSSKSVFAGLFDDRRRKKNKDKAEKAFLKAYGEGSGTSFGSSSAGDGSSSGPRAAIYEAKMGASQKRAQRLQGSSRTGSGGAGVSFSAPKGFVLPSISRKLAVTLSALLVTVLFAGMLYTPMQQYYQQLRERDRLNAEYEAIIARNDSLQDLVDALNTDEGVEDRAHAEFGMVKRGEQSGSVTGIDVVDTSKFQANIAPGSVPAPDTWYSGFLDVFFLYTNGY